MRHSMMMRQGTTIIERLQWGITQPFQLALLVGIAPAEESGPGGSASGHPGRPQPEKGGGAQRGSSPQ